MTETHRYSTHLTGVVVVVGLEHTNDHQRSGGVNLGDSGSL